MKLLHILLLVLNCVVTISVQGKTGITKYVWAPNGLNIRKEASAKSPRIGVLYYGDMVQVDSITDEFITEVLLYPAEYSKDQIFIRSRWVKIKTTTLEGYVIDAYLLDFPCPRRNEVMDDYLERVEKMYGSSSYRSEANGTKNSMQYNGLLIELQPGKQIAYTPKKLVEDQHPVTDREILSIEEGALFKGFTIQEILVFLNPFYRIEAKGDGEFKVRKNGATEVKLTDESRQEIWLRKYDDGFISFYYQGGC